MVKFTLLSGRDLRNSKLFTMEEMYRMRLKKTALKFIESKPGHHKLTTSQLAELMVDYIDTVIPSWQEARDYPYPETHIDYKRMNTVEVSYRKQSFFYGAKWVLDRILEGK